MKLKSSRLCKLIISAAVCISFCQTANTQCITGISSVSVPPGVYHSGYGENTLTLNGASAGYYFYTLGTPGTTLANNFRLLFGSSAVYVAPNTLFSFTGATPLSFSFDLPSNAALCASQTWPIYFYDFLGNFICGYNYTINCKDDSKNNLVVIASGTYYAGDDYKIHELQWNGSNWVYQAITPYGGWGSVEVAGWLAADYNSDQIFFRGRDSKLYNIYKSGGVWYLGPLSATINNVKSDIELRNDGVYYVGTDNYIHRMYWNGSGWMHEAITPLNGWQGITATGSIALSHTGSNIFFRSANNKICNLIGSTGNWYLYQIYSSPASADCGGEIICDDATGIYYKGTDSHVHNMYWSSGWIYDAMSPVSGSATVSSSLTKFPGENRVFFKGTDGRGYNIYKNGSGQWVIDWLNTYMTSVAGDLVAADTKIYFAGTDKLIYNYYWNTSSWYWGALVNSPSNAKGCSRLYRLAGPEDESTNNVPLSPQLDQILSQQQPLVSNLVAYPNPASGKISLNYQLNQDAEVSISLFSIMGTLSKEVTNGELLKTGTYQKDIDLTDLSEGLYLLVLKTGGAAPLVTKIMVE